jgi:TPR repeat protein
MKKKIIILLSLTLSMLNANNFNNLIHSAHYGNVYAQYNLATQYRHGYQSQQDLQKAFRWYHKSAVKGYTPSQYELGLMFHYGKGVKQNHELARLWLTRASKKGHPQAQSVMYRFYSAEMPSKQRIYGRRYTIHIKK